MFSLIHQCRNKHLATFPDALDLQAHEGITTLTQSCSGGLALLIDQLADAFAQCKALYTDETPWLHQSNAWGLMGCNQKAYEQGLIDSAGNKVANVAPFANKPVNGVDLRRAIFICHSASFVSTSGLSSAPGRWQTYYGAHYRPTIDALQNLT